jgi:hypothetical protein
MRTLVGHGILSALAITGTELKVMAALVTIGLRTIRPFLTVKFNSMLLSP